MSSLTAEQLDGLSRRLHDAQRTRTPTGRLTDDHPGLTLEEAYRVQAGLVRRRLDEGETLVGAKLGFTSRAMQDAMGVHEPNYGWLTDVMLADDGMVRGGELIHPKVEPEIAFVLGRDLGGPAVSTQDVLAATAFVAPSLEVVDSRYVGFEFRPYDNVADNSSSAQLVLGARPTRPAGLDLPLVGVAMYVDGALHATAAGAACLGHPASAVAWFVRAIAREDRSLHRGDIILSGGLTAPADLTPGTVVTAEMDRLGEVTAWMDAEGGR